MAETDEAKTPVEPRHRTHAGVAAAVIVALVLVVVALLMLVDTAEVRTEQGLGHVAFGTPVNWVSQDQALDPPLSHRASFASPWENPTTIEWLPLVLNGVIVGLVLTGGWGVVRALRSGRSAT